MNQALLSEQLSQLPFAQYEFFDTEELEFADRIRLICQMECPRYGKTWACPPAVGTVEECRARCLSYPHGLLLVTLTEVSSISDMEACLATRPAHEALTHEAAALLRAQGAEVYGLSCESCGICAECTYPNAPCRHGDKMFPCVESHGIVVTALAEKYGVEYQYGNNVVTWFSLLLYR
jgi:predicted metal-binding protein